MTRRRARLTDFSIPLGVSALVAIGLFWGWRSALVVVIATAVVSAAGLAVLAPWRERLRGTTMEVGTRPLLVYLYSPY